MIEWIVVLFLLIGVGWSCYKLGYAQRIVDEKKRWEKIVDQVWDKHTEER